MAKIYLFICSICSISLLLTSPCFANPSAQTAPNLKTAGTTIPVWHDIWKDFTFSGYLDTSYNYLLRKNVFTSDVDDRAYDLEPNGLTLQQAAVTLAVQPQQGLGGFFNIVGGRDANKLASYGWNPYFGSQTLALDFPQTYLQYTINNFTLIGGKFYTLAGEEEYNPVNDTNFSRSILDGYAEPSTHVGFRGKYVVNDQLKLIAGLNNGWNSIHHINQLTTLELGVDYTMNPRFELTAQAYSGQEHLITGVFKGPTYQRSLIDLVATFKANEKLTFIANYDYGLQAKAALPNLTFAKAVWQGIAGYINYIFTEKWQTSFRGEIFYDENGYQTGIRQNWRELTLTLAFLPLKNIELRAETRHDISNVDSFLIGKDGKVNNNQQSYALEGIYTF